METLRTPDARFVGLPGYPFPPCYVEVPSGDGGRLRMHYVDEGPRSADVVLMLHGEPSWSYLYRKMIPVIAGAGLRAVAPDLIGFGRSDKPVRREDYTYARHVAWMRSFLESLDLRRITLVCQDWGGLIGLRLVAEDSARFARVVAANTFLPTGDQAPPEAFFRWRDFSQRVETFPTGFILQGATVSELPAEVVTAYDAPYPDESYKAGARQFPTLVPATPDDPASEANRAAWRVLERCEKPFLCAFSDSDPITAGAEKVFRARIPGAAEQPHTTITAAGHFLQEDKGEELARVVVEFIRRAPQSAGS
jgi:haloalkane dehalogenase